MEVSGRQFGLYINVGDYANREYSRECGGMTGAEKPRRSAFSFLSHPPTKIFQHTPKTSFFDGVSQKSASCTLPPKVCISRQSSLLYIRGKAHAYSLSKNAMQGLVYYMGVLSDTHKTPSLRTGTLTTEHTPTLLSRFA